MVEKADAGPVAWREDDGVLLVTMRQPPVNPLSELVLDGLDRALDELAGGNARAMVLSSQLPGFFAAGADIKRMATASQEEFEAYGRELRRVLQRIAGTGKPSVAVVEGRALGGGVELALVCTLRVVSEEASFSLPEAQIGLIPSAGATQRLPRYIGQGRALDLLLTGREVLADEAERIGLVDRVAKAGEVEAEARAMAGALSRLSQPVLSDIIDAVGEAQETPLAEGLQNEARRVNALFRSPDAKEGLQAFLEKRPPSFG